MTTLQYCIECANLLYPREDKENRRLIYACRNCEYSEQAPESRIYRNELLSKEGETAGVTQDLGADPTLPRSDKECPRCHETKAVFFQSQQRKADTKMTLFYVCTGCGIIFEDPEVQP
ncbi:DNA-directed RNA polymerase II complex subunit Rpb9 [Protomyces lactucae-debilis]|uniref:DNA-directed RNA polymerase subunit n=1 Tax=Protomyces lactucae-debilis TaxID=2754530 RepID=A0A1Y2F7N5_PROLT|nr:DNA-directed RNA polymerase II complex subunit Rpb9 [Protomyces lactucae-debilis]ORY79940.1 DNA-directed RNA polymerase II complex subunit Rpb9 [Protomyces lactucae-debilis]